MGTDLSKLKKKVVVNLVLFSIIFFLLLFVPAGSLRFWEAWVYYVISVGSSTFLTVYFFKANPELIEHRLQRKERIKEQKSIQMANTVLSIIGFIVPGLDHRFHLSHVPVKMVLLSDVMVLAAYFIFFIVLVENAYASSIIEIQKDHRVISTGPYAVIRHPLYAGALIMFLFTPLALGSVWGLIPFLAMFYFIILRLLNEEEMLLKELPGYKEYCEKVRYRLIPFVW